MGVRRIPSGGQFDQLVTIQQRVPGQNARGQAVDQWTPVATVFAKVEPLRGREFFAAGQMQSEATTRITIRWRAGVDERNRVMWRGEPHDITAAIDPEGQRQVIELMCVHGVRDGRG